MNKYKISATIPVVQYGNIMPELELEGEDLDKLEIQADEFIRKQWAKYAEQGRELKPNSGKFEEYETFTGEIVFYDEENHLYKDKDGNPLIGGSTYAERYAKPFNREAILKACEKAWGVPVDVIADIWTRNSQLAKDFGNALHGALELMHLHGEVGEKIKGKKKDATENYVLPKQPHLRDAVTQFVDKYGLDALPEVMVSDVKNGRVGHIDRLVIVDKKKKVCRVEDYKTGVLDDAKLKEHQHQQSWYAACLTKFGWTVEGIVIHQWDGEWKEIKLDVLEVVDNKEPESN